MTLADSHVKTLLKEGTGQAGAPPSGSEWRVSPEAVTAAKAMAEDYIRRLGATAAQAAGMGKRSTLKASDVSEPGSGGGMMAPPADGPM